MSLFKDKVLLITGGTGSFGNAVLNRFLKTDIGEIRIFSRDEKKQDDMRHDFQARMPEVANKIKFYIGDVRNKSTLKYAMKGVDYVFHAAALKQVPSCEFFPMEAVKTNVIGTDNTLDAAIDAGVKCVICLSTDKAAYPINAMGITKAIEEKIAVAKSRLSGDTKICCTRYGNVMCSRGSVIPLWIDQIRKGNPITLTEPKMTRFIMSLEEAVDLVLFAFEHGQNGDILVQKAPACTIQTQAEAVINLFKHQAPVEPEIRVIGIRHGEKMYETLLTNEECAKAEDMGNFYRVPADNRTLNYDKYFKEGDTKRVTLSEFNSDNTRRLNLEETKEKIASLEYIQNELNGIPNIVKWFRMSEFGDAVQEKCKTFADRVIKLNDYLLEQAASKRYEVRKGKSAFSHQTSDLSQTSSFRYRTSRVPVHLQSVAALANQLLRSGTSIGAKQLLEQWEENEACFDFPESWQKSTKLMLKHVMQ